MIGAITDEWKSLIDEWFRVLQAALDASQPMTHKVTFWEIYSCKAPRFMGRSEPIGIMHWIVDLEGAFLASFCLVKANVRFVVCMLRSGARDW